MKKYISALMALLMLSATLAASPQAASAATQDCDYSSAEQNGGWGWDPVERVSCAPLTANDSSQTTEPTTPPVQATPSEAPTVSYLEVDGYVTVTNLREVRDSAIPDLVKLDYLPAGVASFEALSSAQLDAAFAEPSVVNLADAAIVNKELEDYALEVLAEETGEPTARIRTTRGFGSFLSAVISGDCGGRWEPRQRSFSEGGRVTPEDLRLDRSGQVNDNLSWTLTGHANVEAALELEGEINYSQRRNPCSVFQGTYRLQFDSASLDVLAEVKGDLDAAAEATARFQDRLWEHTENLLDFETDVTIFEVIGIEFAVVVDVKLAVDAFAEAQLRVESLVEDSFVIDGAYEATVECTEEGCEEDVKRRDFEVTSSGAPKLGAQFTGELTIVPSAELIVDLGVNLEIAQLEITELFEVKIGLVVEAPTRLFHTQGNLCSDADGDGNNEHVRTTFVEINADLSAYYEIDGERTWLEHDELGQGSFELANTADLTGEAGATKDVWRRPIFFDVIGEGDNSAFQPVVRITDTGINVVGARDCFPLDADEARFQVHYSEHNEHFTNVIGDDVLRYVWTQEDVVRARYVSDDHVGPWVEVPVPGPGQEDVPATPVAAEPVATTPVSQSGPPACVSAASDPDGDGYGWENNATCLVSDASASSLFAAVLDAAQSTVDALPTTAPNGRPYCASAASDSDGDGWGWENNTSCVVRS